MSDLEEISSIELSEFNYEINSLEYRDYIFTRIERNWKCKKFCDLIISVNEHKFYCHKTFLSALTPFFRCLFQYDLTQNSICLPNQIPQINISDINEECFSNLLEFIYSGNFQCFTNLNLTELIVTADYLMLDTILEALSRILREYLNVTNAIEYFYLAKFINCSNVKIVAQTYIIRKLYQMHLMPDYKYQLYLIKFEDMQDLIRDKRLIINCHDQFHFGCYFRSIMIEIITKWSQFQQKELIADHQNTLVELLDQQIISSLSHKFKLENLRYIEPIFRAYFMNSSPYGRHPPSLVASPYHFRCLGRNIKRTFIDNPPHKWFIKKLIFYIIPDWNGVEAIADISIDYKHYWTREVRTYNPLLENISKYKKMEMELEDDERIIHMNIYHNWLIYGMQLLTSNCNCSLPRNSSDHHIKSPYKPMRMFGSCLGDLTTIDFPGDYPHALYLHGFSYLSISSRSWQAINWLTVYGTMIDKDSYSQDFDGIPLNAEERDQPPKSSVVPSGAAPAAACGIIHEELSSPASSSVIPVTPTAVVQTEQLNLGEIQGEHIIQQNNYPLPHTIEDLFYQWRRYMRLMRLSVVRRADFISLSGNDPSETSVDLPALSSVLDSNIITNQVPTSSSTTPTLVSPIHNIESTPNTPRLHSQNISTPELDDFHLNFREI